MLTQPFIQMEDCICPSNRCALSGPSENICSLTDKLFRLVILGSAAFPGWSRLYLEWLWLEQATFSAAVTAVLCSCWRVFGVT